MHSLYHCLGATRGKGQQGRGNYAAIVYANRISTHHRRYWLVREKFMEYGEVPLKVESCMCNPRSIRSPDDSNKATRISLDLTDTFEILRCTFGDNTKTPIAQLTIIQGLLWRGTIYTTMSSAFSSLFLWRV